MSEKFEKDSAIRLISAVISISIDGNWRGDSNRAFEVIVMSGRMDSIPASKYRKNLSWSLSPFSREIHTASWFRLHVFALHCDSKVVLPYPAGAVTRVSFLCRPSSSCSIRRERATRSRPDCGINSLVDSMGIVIVNLHLQSNLYLREWLDDLNIWPDSHTHPCWPYQVKIAAVATRNGEIKKVVRWKWSILSRHQYSTT